MDLMDLIDIGLDYSSAIAKDLELEQDQLINYSYTSFSLDSNYINFAKCKYFDPDQTIVSKIFLEISFKNRPFNIQDLISIKYNIYANGTDLDKGSLFDCLMVESLNEDFVYPDTDSDVILIKIFDRFMFVSDITLRFSSIALEKINPKPDLMLKIQTLNKGLEWENKFKCVGHYAFDKLCVATNNSLSYIYNIGFKIPFLFVYVDLSEELNILEFVFKFDSDNTCVIFNQENWISYELGTKIVYILAFDEKFKQIPNIKNYLNGMYKPNEYITLNLSGSNDLRKYPNVQVITVTPLKSDINMIGWHQNILLLNDGIYRRVLLN